MNYPQGPQGPQGPYGPPPPYPPQAPYGPPMYPGYGQPPPMMMMPTKSPGIAVMLELLPGFFMQTFGIGNLYAGNLGAGLGLMFGYWVMCAINFALCFIFVGFITWPLTWIGFMILSGFLANNAANAANIRMMNGRMV